MSALEWSPKQIQTLLSNDAKGLSAEKIARVIAAKFAVECSRSAVLGKLHRLARPAVAKQPRPLRVKIEAGSRYKFLVALEEVPSTGRGQLWRFRCDCGNKTVKRAAQVKNGHGASCGRCTLGARNLRHGHTVEGARSPEYRSWGSIKARCSNPKRWYGGRGIKVCARWAGSFEAFLADVGPRPSPQHVLTRINHDGNFEPGNCRWATRGEEQKTKKPRQAADTAGRHEPRGRGA